MKQQKEGLSMDDGLRLANKVFTRDGKVTVDGKTYKLKPNQLNFYIHDIKRTFNTRLGNTM